MVFYVAGKTGNFLAVRRVQDIVRQEGHSISFDWTRAVPDQVWLEGTEQDQDPGYRRFCAERDMKGVTDADALIAVRGGNWCGTLIELGMAMMRGIPIILYGTPERDSVFWFLPNVITIEEQDEEALRGALRLGSLIS